MEQGQSRSYWRISASPFIFLDGEALWYGLVVRLAARLY